MNRDNCRIVLVRPRDPNNIGAVARAMKNFGFRDLAVVAPHQPVWDEAVSAVNAEDVLQAAQIFDDLAEAIADCNMVAGTVDHRRRSVSTRISPESFRDELGGYSGRCAVLFGSEKTGLSNQALGYCHRVISIPTEDGCPSMNLGQAVAVCLYELARGEIRTAAQERRNILTTAGATSGQVESAIDLGSELLREAGYLGEAQKERFASSLRHWLLRSDASVAEIDMLCGALRAIRERIQKGE